MVVAVVALFLFTSSPLAAQQRTPFCALAVVVGDPTTLHSQTASVPVVLINASGKVVQSETTRFGVAKFCDFGFGPHRVVVAPDGCAPVTIDNVRLWPGYSQTVSAILNLCPHPAVTYGSCSVYLRVQSAGRPVSEAAASVGTAAEPFRADAFGRIWFSLSNGTSANVSLDAKGYIKRSVALNCEDGRDLEVGVDLVAER
jgi:hypothetical protein